MSIAGGIAAALRQEAPYAADIQMGAQLIMDFQGARTGGRPYYWHKGTRYASLEKIPGQAFSRASEGYSEARDGRLMQFPAGVSRVNDRGQLSEEARTNSLRASDPTSAVLGVLGSGGGLPLGWYQSTLAGIAYTVVAKGVERGIPYVDLRISGTNTSGAGASVGVAMESTTAIVAAQGQIWAGSFYMQVVGGDLTGITSPSIVIFEWTAAGAFLANGLNPFVPTTALQRASYVRTLTNAATARANLGFTGVVSNGASVDVTLRIGLPQLELGKFITSPIATTLAPATRAADSSLLSSASAVLGSTFAFRVKFVVPDATGFPHVIMLRTGAAGDRFVIQFAQDSGGSVLYTTGFSGGEVDAGYGSGHSAGTIARGSDCVVAVAVVGDTVRWSVNGGAVLSWVYPGGAPVGLDRIALGSTTSGTLPLNSVIKMFSAFPGRVLSDAELRAMAV